jgi:hypothetical protein
VDILTIFQIAVDVLDEKPAIDLKYCSAFHDEEEVLLRPALVYELLETK